MRNSKFVNKRKLTALILISALINSACGKKVASSADSMSSTEAVVESGVTMISGMADEQVGSSFAAQTKPASNIWQVLLGANAYASACLRAIQSSCVNGVKSADYQACDIAGTVRTMSGDVQLSFSNASCAMSLAGDYVDRTYDVQITGARGGVVTHTSAVNADYTGVNYGGGGRLTKTNSGYELEVRGRHTRFERNSKQLFSVSVRTQQNLVFSGGLNRNARTLVSGRLEVNHNLAGFTAVMEPQNIQWSASCCHPVAGKLQVTYSGSRTGTAEVEFMGCGSAQATEGGQIEKIELSYCE